jgi:chromosome condensin MukBEF ATPase and DNA-binding subunit MukB
MKRKPQQPNTGCAEPYERQFRQWFIEAAVDTWSEESNKTMKQEETTPEQYRAELIDEKQRLQAELNSIKTHMTMAVVAKNQKRMAELAAERSELVTELAEIDSDLRQLKQEIQQPNNNMSDLNLIVQLVAAEIAYRGEGNVSLAISRLNDIKTILSDQQ